VPLSAITHGGTFGTVPVAVADQLIVLPVSVPLADPVTRMLPRHVALNVPDPDVPLNCVTAHVKFTHESASDPDDPGNDCVVAHEPPSTDEVVGDGLVLVVNSKQAEAARPAAQINARRMVRRILIIIGLWRF
jgi:hypothetical protein